MNKLKELEQKRAEIDAEIERLKRAKTGKVLKSSDLVEGDEYYMVLINKIQLSHFNDDHVDHQRIAFGIAFHDKQSATNHHEARLLAHECDIAIAESWGGEEINYNYQGQRKYHLITQYDMLRVEQTLTYRHRFAFKTHRQAQAFIDKHGEEAVINMLRNY